MLKISEVEAGEDDRPVADPLPRIIRVEVVINPFEEDMVVRNLSLHDKFQSLPKPSLPPTSNSKNSLVKNKNLLSFEDEEDEE